MLYFNIDNGFLEVVARGFKEALLTSSQYLSLTQCETVEGANVVMENG
jgi:V-type H+-transporting ATPase subunit d